MHVSFKATVTTSQMAPNSFTLGWPQAVVGKPYYTLRAKLCPLTFVCLPRWHSCTAIKWTEAQKDTQ